MDPSRFFPGGDRKKIRSRFGYSDSEFVLLWLGIFMPHRRLEDAIEGVYRLRGRGVNVRLLMAGSTRCYPDYATSLRKLVDSLDLADRITFAPTVGDEEIRELYSACDAFVFPNEHQTWGLAVLEAMACGCPVLVSRGAGVHEVLEDGFTASLFPPRSPDILADKIEAIVCDSKVRNGIARNGMTLVHEKYNWERFADQIASICEKLRATSGFEVENKLTTLC
jgi:glycosyltransferase involved in cell wall biosynthesis